MIADLARRAAFSGRGRLPDLACGTGQLTFPLRDRFTDVWAAEPGMTEVVRAKADAVGADHVRTVTARAEDLDAEPGAFELIVIGNASHRLNRSLMAQRAPTPGSGPAAASRCAGRPRPASTAAGPRP
ncbi:class I SAM-dependent methyltransferase [Streptomyces sp. NPDC002092]